MSYFFFNPFNKQYLFPENFEHYELFNDFYQPYNLKGKVSWWIWKNVRLFQYFSKVKNIQKLVPIEILNEYLVNPTIFAFNRGTRGPEQKISVLCVDSLTGQEFFIKYADSDIPIECINHERIVLEKLAHLDFVPQLIDYVASSKFTFIKTEVFRGDRLTEQKVNDLLLDVLIQISIQKDVIEREEKSDLYFAHGDFCPWNMIICQNELKVYDWEMACYYPLGYDLFTYILQPYLLLDGSSNFEKLLFKNRELIVSYFSHFGVENYRALLLEFVKIKMDLLKSTHNDKLYGSYEELKIYLNN